MSYNRSLYDTCKNSQQVKDTTNPLIYQLYNGMYQNCNNCNKVNKTAELTVQQRTDLESSLMNIDRPLNDCDSTQPSSDELMKKIGKEKYEFSSPYSCGKHANYAQAMIINNIPIPQNDTEFLQRFQKQRQELCNFS